MTIRGTMVPWIRFRVEIVSLLIGRYCIISFFMVGNCLLPLLVYLQYRKDFWTHIRLPSNIWGKSYPKRWSWGNINGSDAGILVRLLVTQICNFHDMF